MMRQQDMEILDLLRQREEAFVKVWQCETDICQLLGLSSYPFEGAPVLPSRIRGKRTAKASAVRRRQVSSGDEGVELKSYPAVRKLFQGEDCYRVVYEHGGMREASFQTDGELLRRLFALNDEDFRLLSIETVRFGGLEDWERLALIWEREATDGGTAES